MFRKNHARYVPAPQEKILEVRSSSVYDKSGVLRVVDKVCDASQPNLPDYKDYTLENLLASGVPLSVVNSQVLSVSPSSDVVENFVNNIVSSDKTE